MDFAYKNLVCHVSFKKKNYILITQQITDELRGFIFPTKFSKLKKATADSHGGLPEKLILVQLHIGFLSIVPEGAKEIHNFCTYTVF